MENLKLELAGALFQCKSAMTGDTHGIPAFFVSMMFGEHALRALREADANKFYLRDMGGYSLQYVALDGFKMIAHVKNCMARIQRAAYLDRMKMPELPEECVVLHNWYLWHNSSDGPAVECLNRYCRYIAAHGYAGGAEKAWSDLSRMDRDGGAAWIRETYSRCAAVLPADGGDYTGNAESIWRR